MIVAFPALLPDELLYSACARHVAVAAYPNAHAAHEELFGTAGTAASIDLPNRLDRLVARLPRGHPYTAEILIERHTMFPYLRCALPRARADLVAAAMRADMRGRGHPGRRVGGGLAVQYPETLRFCRECYEEDAGTPGASPYWRRTHQLPGVVVCPAHRAVLYASVQGRGARSNPFAFAALSAEVFRTGRRVDVPDAPRGTLLAIARDTRWLLSPSHTGGGLDVVRRAFRWALAIDGWIKSGRGAPTDVARIRAVLQARAGDALLASLGLAGTLARHNSWLALLLQYARANGAHPTGTHPVKILLAAYALGMRARGLYALAALSDEALADRRSDAEQRRARARSEVHMPPRRGTGRRLGNPGLEWETRLRRLVRDGTQSVNSIGRALGVAPTTVKRRAIVLNVARAEWARPGTPTAGRRAPKVYMTVDDHRRRFEETRRQHPDAGRAALRRLVKQSVLVLRRSDPDWLAQRMPNPLKAPGGPRVDWTVRDAAKAKEAAVIVARLLADGRGPRVTRTAALRELGLYRSFKQLDRLPKTLGVIDAGAESRVVFWRRRTAWLASEYARAGVVPSVSAFRERAGFNGWCPPDVLEVVQTAVDALRAELSVPAHATR